MNTPSKSGRLFALHTDTLSFIGIDVQCVHPRLRGYNYMSRTIAVTYTIMLGYPLRLHGIDSITASLLVRLAHKEIATV